MSIMCVCHLHHAPAHAEYPGVVLATVQWLVIPHGDSRRIQLDALFNQST